MAAYRLEPIPTLPTRRICLGNRTVESAAATPERLRELLEADFERGTLFWKKTMGGRALAGQQAGSRQSAGYRAICIDQRRYLVHRVLWAMAHGRWPSEQIDHINRDRADNRLANLREATPSENSFNSLKKKKEPLPKGVIRLGRRFRASIQKGGKSFYIGRFATSEEAHAAYLAASKKLYGRFSDV